jgi:hypothetical protein
MIMFYLTRRVYRENQSSIVMYIYVFCQVSILFLLMNRVISTELIFILVLLCLYDSYVDQRLVEVSKSTKSVGTPEIG